MKKALILHGTGGNSKENWFDWLKTEFEKNGYLVWVPNLPDADVPNIQKYNKFILEQKPWDFDEDTIFIGHSSGAVAILGLLQALPADSLIGSCYLVGTFKDDLGWEVLKELFLEPFDLELIKTRAKEFIFIHSDNDPYCPLDHAEYLAQELEGELIVKEGQKHFSVGTFGDKYKQFPFLLELIQESNPSQSTLDNLAQSQKDIEEGAVSPKFSSASEAIKWLEDQRE